MYSMLATVIGVFLVRDAVAAPTGSQNMTLTVPADTTFFPETETLCLPASALDIVIFFFANYVTHATTVKSVPGEKTWDTAVTFLWAFLCPTTGMIRVLDAIFRSARWRSGSELERAAHAGALCVVVRTRDWQPMAGDIGRDVQMYTVDDRLPTVKHNSDYFERGRRRASGEKLLSLKVREGPPCLQDIGTIWRYSEPNGMFTLADRRVHGLCKLPEGYALACLPRDAAVSVKTRIQAQHIGAQMRLASSFSTVKALVALLQTLYAATTLYDVRGDQLARYGFVSFGLTVTHYLVMSIINVIGHLATPDYAAMFLIRSETMDEAERHGGSFSGEVGIIEAAKNNSTSLCGMFEACDHAGSTSPKAEPATMRGPHTRGTSSHLVFRSMSGSSRKGTALNPVCVTLERPCQYRPRGQRVLMIPSCSIERRNPVAAALEGGAGPCFSFWLHRMLSLHDMSMADRVRVTWRGARIPRRGLLKMLARFVLKVSVACLSLIVIGYISHFQEGRSTATQRGWIMGWTFTNKIVGPWIQSVRDVKGITWRWRVVLLLVSSVSFAPAIGGLTTVAYMMQEFGECVNLSGGGGPF